MILKSVGIMSVGKIMGVLYAVLGFIGGCFMSLVAMAGIAANNQGGPGAGAGMLFGAGAIILMPIFYGIMGFIGGIISAALYNFLAGVIGGIEMNLVSDDQGNVSPQGNW